MTELYGHQHLETAQENDYRECSWNSKHPVLRALAVCTPLDRSAVVLQEARVDPDALDHDLKTALFVCARWNTYDAARVLLQHGASVHRRDLDGAAPIMS